MKKKGLYLFIFIMIAMLALAGLYLLRPAVLFVQLSLPDEYLERLSRPSFLSPSYRLIVTDEESLRKDYYAFDPELVIFSPLTEKPAYIDAKSAVWGSSEIGGYDIHFTLDDKAMWAKALQDTGEVSTAFMYSSSDSDGERLFESLKKKDSFVYSIVYDSRISSANITQYMMEIDNNETVSVLMHDPQSAFRLFSVDMGLNYYVDFRDYAALYNEDNLTSIAPDWDKAISQALASEGGEIPFDYTLISSNDFVEVIKNLFV